MNEQNLKEPNEINEINQKGYDLEKVKINSGFSSIIEREQQEHHIQSNITNLHSSACKNYKSGIRLEPANFFL